MRITSSFLLLSLFHLIVAAGCQDSSASSTEAPPATGTTTTTAGTAEPTTEEPTGASTTTGEVGTSSTTTAGEPMTTTTSATSSSTGTTDSTSTTGGEAVDSTSSSTTDGTTTGSTSLDTTGTDSGDSTTEAPEPPPCFPRQVPWAQPCQSAVDDVQVLAVIPHAAYAISVDETHVYFTDYSPPGAPKLHRVSKCGGAVETLASAGSNPCRITMDHHVVYISDLVDNSAIYRVAKFDGSVGVVAANLQQTCPSVVALEDAILFSGHQEPGIWKVHKGWNQQPELAFSTGEKHPGWIDSNGVHVYWNQTWDPNVERILLSGGASEFVTDDLGDYPYEVSCEHVYSNSPSFFGYARVAVDGGPVEKAALERAHRSVMADTHVYFTTPDADAIVEVPLDGGAPAFVSGVGDPGTLAVDATHIFWSDTSSPVIRMAPRPKI